MKISEWLSKYVDSHGIYLTNSLERRFRKQVELPEGRELPSPIWPSHSHTETVRAIKARGLGGNLRPTKHRLAYGWEIAEAIESHFVNSNASLRYEGRGTRFWTCVDELKKAGL